MRAVHLRRFGEGRPRGTNRLARLSHTSWNCSQALLPPSVTLEFASKQEEDAQWSISLLGTSVPSTMCCGRSRLRAVGRLLRSSTLSASSQMKEVRRDLERQGFT